MRVDYLKQLLNMYPDDMEVFIQTVPADLCSPITPKHISLIKASHDARYGLEHAKLLFTAYHPERTSTLPAEQGLQKAREVFDLLYPILDDSEKNTTEAGKACDLVCRPR